MEMPPQPAPSRVRARRRGKPAFAILCLASHLAWAPAGAAPFELFPFTGPQEWVYTYRGREWIGDDRHDVNGTFAFRIGEVRRSGDSLFYRFARTLDATDSIRAFDVGTGITTTSEAPLKDSLAEQVLVAGPGVFVLDSAMGQWIPRCGRGISPPFSGCLAVPGRLGRSIWHSAYPGYEDPEAGTSGGQEGRERVGGDSIPAYEFSGSVWDSLGNNLDEVYAHYGEGYGIIALYSRNWKDEWITGRLVRWNGMTLKRTNAIPARGTLSGRIPAYRGIRDALGRRAERGAPLRGFSPNSGPAQIPMRNSAPR